jgi:hypothetical protein
MAVEGGDDRGGEGGDPVAQAAHAAAPEVIVTVKGQGEPARFRLVGSPVRVAGYDPDYRPPPRLGEHGAAPGAANTTIA